MPTNQKMREQRKLISKDEDDLPIVDNTYNLEDEEVVETVFRKLIQNAQKIDFSKNSQRYIGNSDYTRQRRLQQNRINAVGSYKITQFFGQLEEKSLKWKQKLQETEKRIQSLIDTTEMSKANKVKYVSVIYYIRLLQHESSKIEASQVVATIYNSGNLLSLSQHGKHPSQLLLHDEDVSLKIANYLRATKFKVNLRLVKQYFENNILSKLYINQAQTIFLTMA
ncbi:7116_t:CDS:2 [Dentiscutata erythropus]|uniref:7116_t:CDS:1 n=1 Tax=Dentiscutata erythropus TaxID=1348616 RepID=A0A9N9C992_9GLOM|nr:7116_t:CDS:2 [Dentiscutata erythropus]